MFIPLGDTLTHCALDGPDTAPPVLMLHSIGTTHDLWEPQVQALSGRYRTLRPDLRGHGHSTLPPGPSDMAALARDALAVLDALGLDTVHVAGVSIGARIALQLAADAPGRVRSLFLSGAALSYGDPAGWQGIIDRVAAGGTAVLADAVMPRWVVDATLPSSRGLRQMLLRTETAGYNAAAMALRDARAEDLEGRLPDLPCTVLEGEHDPVVTPAAAARLRAALPVGRFLPLRGGGHIANFEAAAGMNAALLEHLGRC
jgi:3-oxoadipate enol-lactonase